MVKKCFDKYKDEIDKVFNDLKNKDTFYRQIPNILTFMRLVFAIPAGILYYVNPVLSLGAISFLWLTDAVDGPIARKLDIQSKLGADMDTVADKFMFLAAAIPLLVSSPFLGINFLLEAAISLVNVTGRMKGLNTKTVLSGKIKTISLAVTLIVGYLAQFLGIPLIAFNAMIVITTILQLVALKDYVLEYNRMNKELDSLNHDINNIELEKNEFLDKTLVKEETLDKMLELKEIKSLVLSSQLPNKVYSGKKKVRVMMQEKKNI